MTILIAYVVSGSGGNPTLVTPVNTVTHTAGLPLVFAKGGQSIAVTPNGKTAYVPIISLKAVIPIHTATNTALPPIPVGDEPFAMVVTPNGRTVYVGNANTVTPIRVSTNSALPDIPVGNEPARMVITPDGRTVYTVNATDNTVTPIRVSTNTAGCLSLSAGSRTPPPSPPTAGRSTSATSTMPP